jgi:hypothetical protein
MLANGAAGAWSGAGGYSLFLSDGAVFANSDTFDVAVDSYVYFQGGAAVALNNTGTFRKSGGSGRTNIQIPFNNSGTVSAQSGTLQFESPGYTQTAGFTVLEGGTLASTPPLRIQGGSLTGLGTLTADISNAGTASPGSPSTTGALNIAGGYTCADTANLNVRIGGRIGGQFDVLAVTNNAALAGVLNVSLIGGFAPQAGDSFDIMTFNSATGTFIPNLPPLDMGLSWDVQYGPRALTLSVRGAGARTTVTASSH